MYHSYTISKYIYALENMADFQFWHDLISSIQMLSAIIDKNYNVKKSK